MGIRTRRAALIYLTLQIGTTILALWLSKQPEVTPPAATVVALAPTLPGAFLSWVAYRSDRAEAAADVDQRVRALAARIAPAETEHRARLLGEGGHRVDTVFRHRREPANNAAGAAPEGHLAEAVRYYRELCPGRLVITGDPGAGKTLLALEIVLGLLGDRQDTDPVPLRVSLRGWDPAVPFEKWFAGRLGAYGIDAHEARALIRQRRVLPVLDGLDEMDSGPAAGGRRCAVRALAQLNAYQDHAGSGPLVLVCRTAPYRELAGMEMRLREAARVEIAAVIATQATAYLTARCTDPARWASVLEQLASTADSPLARVLSTPAWLNVAATVYEERDPDTMAHLRHPSDLLAFSTVDEIYAHLTAHAPAGTVHGAASPARRLGMRPSGTRRIALVGAVLLAAVVTAGVLIAPQTQGGNSTASTPAPEPGAPTRVDERKGHHPALSATVLADPPVTGLVSERRVTSAADEAALGRMMSDRAGADAVLRRLHVARAGSAVYKLTVTNVSGRPVRVTDVTPVVTRRTAPVHATSLSPFGGSGGTIPVDLDLDVRFPQFTRNGKPYFDASSRTLKPGEAFDLSVDSHTSRYYVEYHVRIDAVDAHGNRITLDVPDPDDVFGAFRVSGVLPDSEYTDRWTTKESKTSAVLGWKRDRAKR
ncbi:hypothetical protein P6B95_19300 [Streptomyces atratus]|uniref:NACHT domain-containing protein n=1 Tax=Streptomyces atratus TaxID=1893 RepID=UPI0016710DAE|nr:hypothetical protein [Streptomyces atratus]WPW29315.1 hypothetical protein P6B95_19300 [Streptomyces atratus]GGT47862.1 hypothetical protein GCM10010207_55490 [Streptomyces atratus]